MNQLCYKKIVTAILLPVLLTATVCAQEGNWVSLFDGTLNGWKVGDNAGTFKADSGMIIVNGNTAHLFYDGPVGNHDFKNFEFKAEVMTRPHSNSGIYFHTAYQQGGWPAKGYEVQVNNSHSDWRRTGSLYAIVDVKDTLVTDNVWYTEYVKVEGKRVIIKINDKVVVDYTEPADVKRPEDMKEEFYPAAPLLCRAMIQAAKFILKILW